MTNEEMSLRTKQALAEALKNVMRTKSLPKITVSELISACDINRKTFYYHFQDIYALLAWMLEQEAIEVVKKFDLLVDGDEAIRFLMEYTEKNDYIVNGAIDTVGNQYIKKFFYADFFSIFDELIETGERLVDVQLEPQFKEFLVGFYTDASAALLVEWAKNRLNQDKETVLKNILFIYKTTIPAVLKAKREEMSEIKKSD